MWKIISADSRARKKATRKKRNGDCITNENLWQKSFFQRIVQWSSKNLWKIISADVKANTKQYEIKYLAEFELTFQSYIVKSYMIKICSF